MEDTQSQLLLKRVINVKAVVTPLWKEEAQTQLQKQINQIDGRLQQIEMQGQRMVSELQKQAGESVDMVNQQIGGVQNKIQILQQLQQVQILDINTEVSQGQIEGFFRVAIGDNMVRKMQVEILLRDGVVEEIRGEL
jgi:YlqD protein